MKSINIKGKQYVMVHERIKEFWVRHPDWSIETHIINIGKVMLKGQEKEAVIMKCEIKDENGVIKATGYAREVEGSSFINSTSHIENTDTSCVGRALGLLGIGIDTSIASAEEVHNAILQQKQQKQMPQDMQNQYDNMKKRINDNGDIPF